MSIAREIDVLVVGLGPAGASAAAAAAEAGLRVLAIDRRREAGEPVQCAEFVPAMIGQELEALGPVIRQRIRAMTTFVEDAVPDVRDDFPGHIVDRAAFDRALATAATAAGVETRFGAPLRALANNGQAVLFGGETVAPRIVIGADGPHSTVGRAIGSVNEALVETRQIAVPLLRPHEATDIFLSTTIPGGYGWLFPKGAIANLGLGVVPTAKARLKPLLAALHGQLADEGRVGHEILGHTGGAIPVGGLRAVQGRLGSAAVLLAGDAAGLTNPVTGAGINAAVISGRLAGRAAADWLGGAAAALDDYAEELEELFGPALARALRRRREILEAYEAGPGPDPAALRRGWIAYPDYWAAFG